MATAEAKVPATPTLADANRDITRPIAIRMHARDRDCKIAITECRTQPTHTPACYHQNAHPSSPLHLPNLPIGRLEGAAHHSTR